MILAIVLFIVLYVTCISLQVNSSRDAMCQTVSEYEESLAQLQTELESTTDQYQEACNEIDKLKHQLASSSGALEEKEQLLINEVCVCVSVCVCVCVCVQSCTCI